MFTAVVCFEPMQIEKKKSSPFWYGISSYLRLLVTFINSIPQLTDRGNYTLVSSLTIGFRKKTL